MYNTYVTKQLFFAEGLVMNNERMTINIYKLDAGYNDKGMNSNCLLYTSKKVVVAENDIKTLYDKFKDLSLSLIHISFGSNCLFFIL